MKVGTDGVLLGAWAPVAGCKRILDVGTGTGLIALMLAQRTESLIDAIEIDPDAARQAAENIAASPWTKRIAVLNTSFQDFCSQTSIKYDLIACNPPFFSNSLEAKTRSRTIARHSATLSLDELISGSKRILSATGRICVIIPADNEAGMTSLAKENDLFLSKIMRIRANPEKDFKRILMEFSFSQHNLHESEMIIENGLRHQYSEEYLQLTRDYYL